MSVREKPPELLQAQTAVFLESKEVKDRHDAAEKTYMLSNLARIAVGPAEDITLDATAADAYNTHIEDEFIPQVEVPNIGEPKTIATKKAYVDFLREKGGSRLADIEGQAALLAGYESFKPDIQKLKQELANTSNVSEHKDFLGNGSGSNALTIERGGKTYVAILPHSLLPQREISSRLSGVVRVKGVPHYEQVIAASYEDGATIAEPIPGQTLEDIPVDNLDVAPEHLSELVDTLQVATQKDLYIDFMRGNFLYDPNEGFGIIDISSANKPRSLAQNISEMSFTLLRLVQNKTTDKKAQQLSVRRLQSAFKTVVQEKLTGEELAEAVAAIDENIAKVDGYIAKSAAEPPRRGLRRVWQRNRKGNAAARTGV